MCCSQSPFSSFSFLCYLLILLNCVLSTLVIQPWVQCQFACIADVCCGRVELEVPPISWLVFYFNHLNRVSTDMCRSITQWNQCSCEAFWKPDKPLKKKMWRIFQTVQSTHEMQSRMCWAVTIFCHKINKLKLSWMKMNRWPSPSHARWMSCCTFV